MERRTAPVADDGLARRRTRLRLMRHDHTRVALSGRMRARRACLLPAAPWWCTSVPELARDESSQSS